MFRGVCQKQLNLGPEIKTSVVADTAYMQHGSRELMVDAYGLIPLTS